MPRIRARRGGFWFIREASVPKIAIEIGNSRGRKRLVSIDPVTGVPQSAIEGSKTL